MKTRTLPVLALLCALAGVSCKKDKPVVLDGDWLFPIAKTSFSLNSLNMFRRFGCHMEISPGDIKQPVGQAVSSQGLSFAFLGPSQVPVTNCISRLDVDTLSFSGILTNNFPVAIGAGTRMVMRTTTDTTTESNIAGLATVPEDIPPGGSFSFDVLVRNKVLGKYVYFFLENFRTPAFSKIVFLAKPTTLDIKINILTASYVEVFTNRECSSEDTAGFSVSDRDESAAHSHGAVSDSAMSGVINVFADNSLPAAARMQLYFLNADKTQVIDSLFYPSIFEVGSGRTGDLGQPEFSFSGAAKVPISTQKLERMKQASFVASKIYLSTAGMSGATVSANRDAVLKLQFTGDLRLNIRF